VIRECCNCQSARPQLETPGASGLLGGAYGRWLSGRLYCYPNLRSHYFCWMGQCTNEIKQPNTVLGDLSWPTIRQDIWFPDAYAWRPPLPSAGWHLPTYSRRYGWRCQRGIGCWCWNVVPKSMMVAEHKNRLQNVRKESLKDVHQTVAIPWSHPQPCSWSLCQSQAKHCCWWGCGMAMWACLHCESSCCGLLANRKHTSSGIAEN